MNNNLDTIFKQMKNARLTDEERASLLQSIRMRTVEASPLGTVSPYSSFFVQYRAIFASLAIVLFSGSSLAFAARGALPGELLYPIKTQVLEQIARLTTAKTPGTTALFETRLLDIRLSEAETLDKHGKLPAPVKEMVRTNILEQSTRADLATDSVISAAVNAHAAATAPMLLSVQMDSGTTSANSTQTVSRHSELFEEAIFHGKALIEVTEKHQAIIEKIIAPPVEQPAVDPAPATTTPPKANLEPTPVSTFTE